MSKNSKEFKEIIKSENIATKTNFGKLLLPSEKYSNEQLKVEHISRPQEKPNNQKSKRNKSKIPLPVSKSPDNLQASESGESKSTAQDILSGNSTESCRRSRRRKEWNKPIKVTSLLRPKISKLKTRLSKTSSRKIEARKNQTGKYIPDKIPSGISTELPGTLVSSEDLIKTTYLGDLELPKSSGNLKKTLSEVQPESLKRLEGCLNIQKAPLQTLRALKLNVSLNNSNTSSIKRNVPLDSPNVPLGSPNALFGSPNVPFGSPNAPSGSLNAPLKNSNVPLKSLKASSYYRNTPLDNSNTPLKSPNTPLKNSNVSSNNRNTPLKSPNVPSINRNAPLNSPNAPSNNPRSPLKSPNSSSINKRLSPNNSKASSNNQNASNWTLNSKRIDLTPKSSVAVSEIQKASIRRLGASFNKQITFLVEPQPKSDDPDSEEESQKKSGTPKNLDKSPESSTRPLETSNKARVTSSKKEVEKTTGSPARKLDASLQNLEVIQELLKQPRRVLKAPPKKGETLRKFDRSPKQLEKSLTTKTPVEEPPPNKKFEITPSDLENLSRTLEVTRKLEEKLKVLEEKKYLQTTQKLGTGNRKTQIKNLQKVDPSLGRLKVSLKTQEPPQKQSLPNPRNPDKKSEFTPKKVEFDPLKKLDSTLKKLEASLKERPSKTFLKKIPKKPFLPSTKISKNFEVSTRKKKTPENSIGPTKFQSKSLAPPESPSGSQKNSLTPQGSVSNPQEYQKFPKLNKLPPEIISAKREFLKKISSSSLNELQRIVSKKFRNHHLRRREKFYQVEINKDQMDPQDSVELHKAKRKNVKFDTCRFGEKRKSMIPTRITVNKSRVRQKSILVEKSQTTLLQESGLETVDSDELEVLKDDKFLSSTDLGVYSEALRPSSRKHPKLAKLCISAIQTASFIPKEKTCPQPSFLTRNIENLKKFGKKTESKILKVPKVDKLKEPNKCRLMVKKETTELTQKVPSSKNVFTYTVTQHDRNAIKPCHIMLYIFGSLLKHVPKVLGSFIPGLMKEEDLEETKSISISINYEEIQKAKDKELMKQKKFRTNDNYIPPWEAYKHMKPTTPPKDKLPEKDKPPPDQLPMIEPPPGYCQKGQLKAIIKKIESSISKNGAIPNKKSAEYSCKTIATTTQADELGSVVDFIKRVEKMETEVKQLTIQKPMVLTEVLSSLRHNWLVCPKKKAPKPNLLRLLKAAYRLFVETDNTFRGRTQGSNSTTAVRRSVSTMYNPPPINPLLFSRRHFDTDTESSFLNFANIFCLPEFCKIWKKNSKNREMDKNLIISFRGKMPKSSTSFICPVLSNKDVPFIIVGGSTDDKKAGNSKKRGPKVKKRKGRHCIAKRSSMGSSLPDIYYEANSGENSASNSVEKTTTDSISRKSIPTIPISDKIDPTLPEETSITKNSIYGDNVPPSRMVDKNNPSSSQNSPKTTTNTFFSDKPDFTLVEDKPISRSSRRDDLPSSRQSKRHRQHVEKTIQSSPTYSPPQNTTPTIPMALFDKLDPTIVEKKPKSRSSNKDSIKGNNDPCSTEFRNQSGQLKKPLLPINFCNRPLPKLKSKSSKHEKNKNFKDRYKTKTVKNKPIVHKSSSLSSLSSLEFEDDLVQTTDFCCDVDFVETKDENEMTFETTISSISTFKTDSKLVVNKIEETKRISFEDIDELIRMLKSEFCDA